MAPVLLFCVLLFSACGEEKSSLNNFQKLQISLEERDEAGFCRQLSRSSKEDLERECPRAISELWPKLQTLFRGGESLGREGDVFFLRKGGEVLSYPLKKEGGIWKADIIGEEGWKEN